MDVNALRMWGIVAASAMIATALTISFTARVPDAFAQPTQPPVVRAQPIAPAGPIAFLVRFRGEGPIAQAQARAARGQTAPAQRVIEAQLTRQSAFAGLCFDRFTAGASEVVLRTCEAVAPARRNEVQQSWLRRLSAMRAVEYVDPNATATAGQTPR